MSTPKCVTVVFSGALFLYHFVPSPEPRSSLPRENDAVLADMIDSCSSSKTQHKVRVLPKLLYSSLQYTQLPKLTARHDTRRVELISLVTGIRRLGCRHRSGCYVCYACSDHFCFGCCRRCSCDHDDGSRICRTLTGPH